MRPLRLLVVGFVLVTGAAVQAGWQSRADRDHQPLADAQHVSVNEDQRVLITLSGSDAVRHRLMFVVTAEPLHGTLEGRPPRLIYTPAANYHGSDSLTFKATDGRAESAPAVVSLSVTPVNDPPTTIDDTLVMGRNAKGYVGPGAVDVLMNDSDAPDADETLTVVNTQQGVNGGTGFSSTTVYYLPNGGFVGNDRFTYTVCDNGTTNGKPDPKCTLAIVTVTVKESIEADLSVSVLRSPAVSTSSNVTVVATVRNNGPDPANLITYGLEIGGPGAVLVSLSGAAGRCSSGGQGFECVLGTLAPGATVDATVVLNVTTAEQSRVTARVSSATDSTPFNNLDSTTVEER